MLEREQNLDMFSCRTCALLGALVSYLSDSSTLLKHKKLFYQIIKIMNTANFETSSMNTD